MGRAITGHARPLFLKSGWCDWHKGCRLVCRVAAALCGRCHRMQLVCSFAHTTARGVLLPHGVKRVSAQPRLLRHVRCLPVCLPVGLFACLSVRLSGWWAG